MLLNCATYYNVATKQVKAWKEALYAAEGGGDIAFAEVRKVVSSPSTAFSGWTSPAAAPAPTPGPSYSNGPFTFGQNNSLSASVTVDMFYTDRGGAKYYRIRSAGTAKLFGLPRTGLDSALTASGTHFASNSPTRGSGDTLLRKIDFNFDHFKATYGDGDGHNLTSQALSTPRITRRIELIAAPQFAFTGAVRATGSFYGPGSAGVVDSYDSKNGAYYFAANNPSDPHYADSQNGDVSVATSTFTEGGPIYGNLTTNGANITHANSSVSGTIDNNAPFTLPPLVRPDTASFATGSGSTLDVPPGTTLTSPVQYSYSSLSSGLTINGQTLGGSGPNNNAPIETYVIIVVGAGGATTGDVGDVVIAAGVNAKIYFTGSLTIKAKNADNNNVDGATGIYNADGSPSTNYSRAAHLQFYGVSPTDGSTGTINIAPPGGVWATIYAPNHDYSMNGNPQWYGAIACHNFNGNGDTGFHYDKELGLGGIPIDYQVASYIEDIR